MSDSYTVINRKNDDEKFMAKKDAINQRRKHVYIMDQQGFSNKDIAEQLQISLSTVEKDLHEIKFQALSWYDEWLPQDSTNYKLIT